MRRIDHLVVIFLAVKRCKPFYLIRVLKLAIVGYTAWLIISIVRLVVDIVTISAILFVSEFCHNFIFLFFLPLLEKTEPIIRINYV